MCERVMEVAKRWQRRERLQGKKAEGELKKPQKKNRGGFAAEWGSIEDEANRDQF